MRHKLLTTLICIALTVGKSDAQEECPVAIPDESRQECYPWEGATSEICESRGCVWCPHETEGVPWCFKNPDVCPSEIADSEREDCHPEPDANKEACLLRGCTWCLTSDLEVPWCFVDNTVSQGGAFCLSQGSPHYVPEEERLDCIPEGGAGEDACVQRGCFWCPADSDAPWCYVPREQGYKMLGEPTETPKGYHVALQRKTYPTWYSGDLSRVDLEVEFQEDHRLRVKIFDPSSARWEVPLDIPSPPSAAPQPLYDVEFSDTPSFNFKVIRRSNGAVLFDTSMGGFIFSDPALIISTRLSSGHVYGFGETEHHSFQHDLNFREWGMYARDQPVMQGNLYGVHPFFTNLDSDANMHGVLFLNSNAQEVELLPAPGLVYRTTGGILDLYFFLGPSPEGVIQQYTEAIGRSVMPPYWSLGFHQSRYGFNTLETMQATVQRYIDNDIPLDVLHGDIDTFDRNLDFTYDQERFAGLPEYVRDLKQEGIRYITIQDPFIGSEIDNYPTLDRGNVADAWLKEGDGILNAEGQVWPPGNSYFADFSKPSAQDWWIEECRIFDETIDFDGLWIDMNEPANFVTGSIHGCYFNGINNPLFKPRNVLGDVLADKTVCGDYLSVLGRQADVHNLYGWSQAEPSLRAARVAADGRRSIVISRSTFPGANKHATHWTGDNHAEWSNIHYSIISSLEFNLFGFPYVGADICGFLGDSNEELCLRWHQVGAFYTFARNHNGIGWADHDPGQWPSVAAATREVLNIRYTLLPYLYTLLHRAHTEGSTVFRPLLHEFVTDANTYDIDRQFLWGPAFMVSPVIDEGVRSVEAYFPDARWYSWYDGAEESTRMDFTFLDVPLNFIPLHVRGGHVLPTQLPANSTVYSRKLPMGLVVALDDSSYATGSLFWDEGDTVDTYENGEYFLAQYGVIGGILEGTVENNGYPEVSELTFDRVRVMGLLSEVNSVTVNGQGHDSFEYIPETQVLMISELSVPVASAFTIQWS